MAATNYTPIQLYNSGTTGNAPSAGNLAAGELAINYTDGKLFYKDNSSAIQVIAWKTTPTTAGGTGLTSYTAGDLPYYASGTALSKLAIGSANYVLTSSGSAPQYVAQSTLSVGSATNAANVGTTDNTSSSSTYYPTLVSATSGNNPITTSSTKLSFVPSTGVLTTTGIKFGSSTVLNDYEEGTWTPSLGDGAGGFFTMTSQNGSYVKIGRMVIVQFYIAYSSHGTASGGYYLNITGWPFSSLYTGNVSGSNIAVRQTTLIIDALTGPLALYPSGSASIGNYVTTTADTVLLLISSVPTSGVFQGTMIGFQ